MRNSTIMNHGSIFLSINIWQLINGIYNGDKIELYQFNSSCIYTCENKRHTNYDYA